MALLRTLVSVGLTASRLFNVPPRGNTNSVPVRVLAALMSTQAVSVSKSLDLVTAGGDAARQQRPLVVMLAWLMAKKQHINKYCDFYVKRGCDVLTVYITPRQLLWPVSGSQLVAEEVLQFLLQNGSCRPLLLHGFSVGGYVWGEVMVKMKQDLDTYQPIIDRIIGQTWDSAADVTEIQVGLPLAVFPKNPLLRMCLHKYIGYHLKAFDKQATTHYLRSSQMFHTNLVHSPALLLLSKTDPVGSMTSNLKLKDIWQSMGIKVTWKCWDDSKHVSHYLKYKDEYIETLENFLDSLNKTEKLESELSRDSHLKEENIKEKLQAKL